MSSELPEPYIPAKEESIGMLDGGGDSTVNGPTEEVDNVQINDVVVDRVGFKDVESALMTLKQFLEQRSIDVTSCIQST